jgi:hypothetical protein
MRISSEVKQVIEHFCAPVFPRCFRLVNSLPSSIIYRVGSGDRRNDLTGGHDRIRVVWDIDVEGSVHHLV